MPDPISSAPAPQSAGLAIYFARYFSGVDWSWLEVRAIAASEAQVRTWIDGKCKPEFRNKPTRGPASNAAEPFVDSLTITREGEIQLPFEIHDHI